MTPVSVLHSARRQGYLWVAVTSDDRVIGFAYAQPFSGDYLHLCELDVVPEHGRKGAGSALLSAVEAAAASDGFRYVSLTTFRNVPFNAPFYGRRGYVPLDDEELCSHLADELAESAARGFDESSRVAMRKLVGAA